MAATNWPNDLYYFSFRKRKELTHFYLFLDDLDIQSLGQSNKFGQHQVKSAKVKIPKTKFAPEDQNDTCSKRLRVLAGN